MKPTFEYEMIQHYRPTQDSLKECIAAFTKGDKETEEEISISLNRDPCYIAKCQERNRIIGLRAMAKIGKEIPFPKALVKIAKAEHAERMVVRKRRMKRTLDLKTYQNTVKMFHKEIPLQHQVWSKAS